MVKGAVHRARKRLQGAPRRRRASATLRAMPRRRSTQGKRGLGEELAGAPSLRWRRLRLYLKSLPRSNPRRLQGVRQNLLGLRTLQEDLQTLKASGRGRNTRSSQLQKHATSETRPTPARTKPAWIPRPIPTIVNGDQLAALSPTGLIRGTFEPKMAIFLSLVSTMWVVDRHPTLGPD